MPNKDVKDMLDSPRQDENTYWRTWGRIFQNGWQAGSVVGTAVVFPALVAKSEGSGLTDSIDGAGKAAVAGIGLAGVIGAWGLLNEERHETEGRLYQLYYNDSVRRRDRFAQVGAVVGATTAAITEKKDVWSVLGHAAAGTSIALIAHVLTDPGKSHMEQAGDHLKSSLDHTGDAIRNRFGDDRDRR